MFTCVLLLSIVIIGFLCSVSYVKIIALLLIEQEMEVDPKQQIEEELRRVLNLNPDQPSLKSSQPEGSICVSAATSLPSGDVQYTSTNVGSPSVASSPQSTVSVASPVGASEKILAASLSSPSINHFKQASHANKASRRNRRPKHSKQNSPQQVPYDAVGVTGSLGNGRNVSVLTVKPESPGMNASEMASTTTASNNSASSALFAGLCTSGSLLSTGMNSSNNVTTATKTFTNKRGGKASRGRGSKKHMDLSESTVPGRSLEKPECGDKCGDHIRDVCASDVLLSEQLSSAAGNVTGNVKSELLPTADENVTELSTAAVAKIAEKTVQQPIKKHEKGRVCVR